MYTVSKYMFSKYTYTYMNIPIYILDININIICVYIYICILLLRFCGAPPCRSSATPHGTNTEWVHERSATRWQGRNSYSALGEFSRKIREIGIPNNSRISVFTLYLPNLVYWVGFVTGITFTLHL